MAEVFDNGTKLWYEVTGDGDPLTLIGGFALLHNQFDFCNEILLDAGIQTIHWNYRGSGNSDWTMTEPFSIERWVDDLKVVLDDAGIEKTSIWCTSTSTPIGMRFAAKYPDRMNALVTYPFYRTNDYWREVFTAAHWCVKAFGLTTLSRAFASVVLTAETQYSPEHFTYEKWAAPNYERNVNPTTMGNIMDVLSNIDLTNDIPRIKCPTLLLMGQDSVMNEKAGMELGSFDFLTSEFLRLKPDAEIAAVKGAGSTYCMITMPKETTQFVIDFLEKCRKERRA